MNTLANFAVFAARATPRFLKQFIAGNRSLNRIAHRAFAKAASGVAEIQSGPMKGLKLQVRQHVLSSHISGEYEPDTVASVARLLHPNFVCYDLGASIGYLSLLMARNTKHVYAFEPAPHAIVEIRAHIAANGFSNVTVVPEPVSDLRKPVRFTLTDVAYGSRINGNTAKWPVLEVTTTTLDEFVSTNPAPDFIKIDVEGEEARVLRGAYRVLREKRPLICCEVHSSDLAVEVSDILKSAGYSLENLNGTPFTLSAEVIPGEVLLIARPTALPFRGLES